jgi:hypothetical protein
MTAACRIRPLTRTTIAAFVAVACAAPSPVRAADLPTIHVDDAGPDADIPIGSSFYLSGPVTPTTASAHVVVVRAGVNWLFGTTGPECSAIAAHFAQKSADDAGSFVGPSGGPSKSFPSSVTGETTVGRVWRSDGSSTFPTNMAAFVAPAWMRNGHADTDPFKILVPDDRFFASSGRYCVFVYRTEETKHVDDTQARAIVAGWARDVAQCTGDSAKCLDTPQAAREQKLAALGAPLDAAARSQLLSAVRANLGSARQIYSAPLRLEQLLGALQKNGVPGASGALTLAFDPTVDRGTADPFARAVLGMLAEAGAVVAVPASPNTFATPDQGIVVDTLHVTPDLETVVVSGHAPAGGAHAPVSLATHTGALTVGFFDDITLKDFLQFLRGRLRIADQYVAGQDLAAALRPLRSAIDADVPSDAQAKLDALGSRADKLSKAVRRALTEAAAPEPPVLAVGTDTQAARDLGLWLRPLLKPCDDAIVQSWGLRRSGMTCAAADNPPAWPRYRAPGESPLEFIHGEVSKFDVAYAKWAANKDKLAITITEITTTPYTRAEVVAHVTQDQWVFSYLTPTIGEALFVSPRESFAEPYLAVQLHLVPNLVDQPLFSKQNDWQRMVALELGMATARTSLGPDGRFAGWKGLPPLLFGVALHPIPYTSITGGGALFERRSSTVTAERSSAYVSWFVAANVQINIPDLVVALKGRTSTSTPVHNP